MYACVHACACVCACVHACVRVCVCVVLLILSIAWRAGTPFNVIGFSIGLSMTLAHRMYSYRGGHGCGEPTGPKAWT